jgi:hypothetical protein
METVAQALLVLYLTHSGKVLGLTTAARYAPILLLSPYSGLLLVTQAGLGLVSASPGASARPGRPDGLAQCTVSSTAMSPDGGQR